MGIHVPRWIFQGRPGPDVVGQAVYEDAASMVGQHVRQQLARGRIVVDCLAIRYLQKHRPA